MSEISLEFDVELAHKIAANYISRRSAQIEKARDELVEKVYNERMKKWFGKPKSRGALREELKETDEWHSISLHAKYQADRMADLVVVCAAAMRTGVNAITISGDSATDVAWEIMLNALEGKESNA